FGNKFGIQPTFDFQESDTALLSNAAKSHQLFGCPSVQVSEMIDWIADWVSNRRTMLNKPTHFSSRDGKF
ncbi:MAG TPA: hypothetical protein VJ731_05565, partial [Terriglobales bacterium]|nr:hypothetical protein [Terriglobales bacterium]